MIRIRGMVSLTKHPSHPGSTLRVYSFSTFTGFDLYVTLPMGEVLDKNIEK